MKHEYGGVEYEGESFYCYSGSNVLLLTALLEKMLNGGETDDGT
jgi:hypothetical protein